MALPGGERMRAIAISAAALTLSGCVHPHPVGPVNGYLCEVERSGPEGDMRLQWNIGPDGAPLYWYGHWEQRVGTVKVTVYWNPPPGDGEAPLHLALDDTTDLQVILYRAQGDPSPGRAGYVVIEFRREAEGAVAFKGWVNAYAQDSYTAPVELGQIRAAAGARWAGLTAVDSRRPDRVLARGILDPGTIERAKPLIERVQAEMEAMRADYRNRCIVTHGEAPDAPAILVALPPLSRGWL